MRNEIYHSVYLNSSLESHHEVEAWGEHLENDIDPEMEMMGFEEGKDEIWRGRQTPLSTDHISFWWTMETTVLLRTMEETEKT